MRDARAGLIRPSREEAESAVRTLIAFAGDDPEREGLIDTPKRVVGAYEELYRGYTESPAETLERTFSETGKYDDMVLVKDIVFNGLATSLAVLGPDLGAQRLAERARQHGVRVELKTWHRMPHVFPMFADFLPEGRRT